jgi:hypothetical protein
MGGYLLQNGHLRPRRVIKAGSVDQVDDMALKFERLRKLHFLCARCKFVGYSEIRSADKIDELEYSRSVICTCTRFMLTLDFPDPVGPIKLG